MSFTKKRTIGVINNNLKNENGFILTYTIIIFMVLMIFLLSLAQLSFREQLRSINSYQRNQAHQFAMSGVSLSLQFLKSEDGIEWLEDNESEKVLLGVSDYQISIINSKGGLELSSAIEIIKESGDNIVINSTGYFKNQEDFVRIQLFKDNLDDVIDEVENIIATNDAIFITGESENEPLLDIKGSRNSYINGDITIDNNGRSFGDMGAIFRVGRFSNEEGLKLRMPYIRTSQSFEENINHFVDDKNYNELSQIYKIKPLEKEYSFDNVEFPKSLNGDCSNFNYCLEMIDYNGKSKELFKGVEIDGTSSMSGGVIEGSVFIDATHNGLELNDVHFQSDVFILSEYGNVEINDSKFDGTLNIKGYGDTQIENSDIRENLFVESRWDNVQLRNMTIGNKHNNNKITIKSEDSVDFDNIDFYGDVFVSTEDRAAIQFDSNINIFGNLFVNNRGLLQFSHSREMFVDGYVYAPFRNVDIQEDIHIKSGVIAGGLRFDEAVKIDAIRSDITEELNSSFNWTLTRGDSYD